MRTTLGAQPVLVSASLVARRRVGIDDAPMHPRPRSSKLLALLLLVAGLLSGCSLSTPLCDAGDQLAAAGQPARALEVYAQASAHGDGCAADGLDSAGANQRRAAEEAARGEVAERAGDVAAAAAAYQAALGLDVTSRLAVAGLARLDQPAPVAAPMVVSLPPAGSWWAGPWPYFIGSVLIAALLSGAVMWFVERRTVADLRDRLRALEQKSLRSHKRFLDIEQGRVLQTVTVDPETETET